MFAKLDKQLATFAPRLRGDLLLSRSASNRVASALAEDLNSLGPALREALADGDPVDFDARYSELIAFQGFMDASQSVSQSPFVTRARVLIQNYVCFVYLKEAWLEQLLAI